MSVEASNPGRRRHWWWRVAETGVTVLCVLLLLDITGVMRLRERYYERKATSRIQEIENAAASGVRKPWEGVYYSGDGLGFNLRLAVSDKLGAAYTQTGCLGCYGAGTGTVSEDGDVLVLTFKSTYGQALAWMERLFVVRWGDRVYLVGADQTRMFAERINDAVEPRNDMHGPVLLRVGDENKPVSERPILPWPESK